jgi:CTD small phosphatase-like protein 2
VRVEDGDDDDDARSLESDEAEETESDGAVLAASSRGGDGAGGTGKGALQDGFGKYTEAFVDDEYTYEDELDDEEYDEEFDPWVFIHGLPPLSSCVRANRPPILPRKSPVHKNKNTLVLDLDETLVHSNLEQTIEEADFSFPVTFNGQQHIVNVKRRPYLTEFMEFAARHFEVVVFTASQRVYAERLLNKIDPNQVLIKHRLYRESCVLVEGNYMKDLSVLGRDLGKTIIVDNSPQAFGFQVDNGVPIESWFDDQSDRQLLKLMPLLARLAQAQDVRPVLRKKFALEERIERAGERSNVLNSMGSPRR